MGLSGRKHRGTVESGREVCRGRKRHIDRQREESAWNVHIGGFPLRGKFCCAEDRLRERPVRVRV